MALGDGIRRNIADVEPAEREMFRDALIQMNHRFFPGTRDESPAGGVSWWFKQDEIHQATHVHEGPEFLPWHRELINRFEAMLRSINRDLSLHYWDWTQDPTNIPNANLGGGTTGTLNLFTPDFMGYGGTTDAEIGEPWKAAGYYDPAAAPNNREATGNPADPPLSTIRHVSGSPAAGPSDDNIVNQPNYPSMRTALESVHDTMHGFVAMGPPHRAFEDPFVFLLHSNVDRLFARWQTDPVHPERLEPLTVYGAESNADVVVENTIQNLNNDIEPWSSGDSVDQFGNQHLTRPWYLPEDEGVPKTYKDPSVVAPPCYDTNFTQVPIVEVRNLGEPPVVNFNDVPEGETTARAGVFRIYGCTEATVRVKPGGEPAPPFSVLSPVSGSITVVHEPRAFADVRIWLGYKAGTAGVPVPDGAVTFECPESGQEFSFVIKANSIPRPDAAIVLALDQSGSMDDPAGSLGATRVEVLKEAATRFVQLVPPNSGVGLIRFDHDAYPVGHGTYPGLAVRRITTDADLDPDRVAAINAVATHATNPTGFTSVGDGLVMARTVLNALPPADYDHSAIIAFTDGLENRDARIADVMGSIDARTFAIGLGNETQVNTNALKALTEGTGGYLQLTGLLGTTVDDYFLLTKYFHQILAGVTNTDIIVDPSGFIAPGSTVEIPFELTEADIEATAIVLMDLPVVNMSLRTPSGDVIDPGNASALGLTYAVGENQKHYRYSLPVALGAGAHVGTWTAILTVDGKDRGTEIVSVEAGLDEGTAAGLDRIGGHGARYSFIADTYSNMRLRAAVIQPSLIPGAQLIYRAVLTEYGLPVDRRAQIYIDVTRPDQTSFSLPAPEVEPGVFEAELRADLPGIYRGRFMVRGASLLGNGFTRETSRTAAVYAGGDDPLPRSDDHEFNAFLKLCCNRPIWLAASGVVLLLLILIVLLLK